MAEFPYPVFDDTKKPKENLKQGLEKLIKCIMERQGGWKVSQTWEQFEPWVAFKELLDLISKDPRSHDENFISEIYELIKDLEGQRRLAQPYRKAIREGLVSLKRVLRKKVAWKQFEVAVGLEPGRKNEITLSC